jgi:hypothetical protein
MTHGGGRRCSEPDCEQLSRGASGKCKEHGGDWASARRTRAARELPMEAAHAAMSLAAMKAGKIPGFTS